MVFANPRGRGGKGTLNASAVEERAGAGLLDNRVPYNSLPERVEPLGRAWRAT